MKNSRLREKIEEEPVVLEWFEREKVVRAFRKMGFNRDYEGRIVGVLRNSNFPFQRIVLPYQKTLHIELLKLYTEDLGIPFPRLINLLKLLPDKRLAYLMDAEQNEDVEQRIDVELKKNTKQKKDVKRKKEVELKKELKQKKDVRRKKDVEPKKELKQKKEVEQRRLEDHKLINLARQGDQKAFESLLNKYRNLVYHVMIKMVGISQEAEDLTQEAFIKAFNALATFNEEFAFSTWLMKIATNNCIDYLRKKKLKVFSINEPIQYKDEELQYEIPDQEMTPDRKMLAEERSKFINSAIQSLPPRYRHVILLRHKEEKSYEEIAEILSLPLGTVKARIFRAREMLNKKIKNLD